MQLYIILTIVLFMTLILSVTDCGDNVGLRAKQKTLFSQSVYKWIFFLLILLFWFLTAFRGSSIGNDTSTYLGYYKRIEIYGVDSKLSIELGFQYFCLFLSRIISNPYFLLIVCATVCYLICGLYIYKHSNNVLFSLILLFCVAFSFFASGIRQSIAMVIVLMAYPKIKNGKKILPIVFILFASLFHISALVAFLWFAHRFIPKKPIVITIIALCVSVLSVSGVLNTLLASVLKEYKGYFESEYVGTGWLGILYYCLRAFVFYIFIYTAYKGSTEQYSLTISNSVLLLFTVCLGFSVNLFSRASLYFLLISVVDIPNAFNSGKIRNRDVWMLIMGGIMLAYFIVTLIIRPEWNNLYPYQFNWN